MRQGLFPICIVCAVTAASSRKNFDKPSIATEKSFCNSKGVHSRSKQCLRIYKDHFCVAKCLLGNPKPFLICTVPMQAARFCKTLFQHSIYCEEIGIMSMLQPRLRNRLKYRISVSLPSQIRYTTGLRFLAWTDLRLISFILPMLHSLQ